MYHINKKNKQHHDKEILVHIIDNCNIPDTV